MSSVASGAAPSDRARLRGRALVPGLVGGGLAALSAVQPWWRAVGEGVSVRFSGSQATAGLTTALAVVALAGWLLVLGLRTRGRQVVAALLTLTGAAVTLVGLLRLRPTAAAVRSQVREVSLADSFALRPTGWSWAYAAAGLLVLAGGVAVLLTAPRWPARPDRFSRAATTAAVSAGDDPAAVWRAQDAGLDPTAVGPASGPDVRDESFRTTMAGADTGGRSPTGSGPAPGGRSGDAPDEDQAGPPRWTTGMRRHGNNDDG